MEIISAKQAEEYKLVSTRKLAPNPILEILRTLEVDEVLKFPVSDWKYKNTPSSKINRYFSIGGGKALQYVFKCYKTTDGFYLAQRIK